MLNQVILVFYFIGKVDFFFLLILTAGLQIQFPL